MKVKELEKGKCISSQTKEGNVSNVVLLDRGRWPDGVVNFV